MVLHADHPQHLAILALGDPEMIARLLHVGGFDVVDIHASVVFGELPNQAESTVQTIQSMQTQAQGLSDSVARDRDRRLIVQRTLADLQRVASELSAAAQQYE